MKKMIGPILHWLRPDAASLSIGYVKCATGMQERVSGGDAYQQGYAAGASAKERNSFNAFDSGYLRACRSEPE